jgi:phosphoglycolate phosphatase-like HAD superfamily hydrolase
MHLIMFDIDGTLTQSYEYDRQVFAMAFKSVFHCDQVDTEWAHYTNTTSTGITREAAFKATGREAGKAELAAVEKRLIAGLEQRYRANSAEFIEVPGAGDMLSRLAACPDLTAAIATGCWSSEARFKLRASGLEVDGIPIATSDDAVAREQVMRLAESKAKLKNKIDGFDRVIYVGDGIWDFAASMRLGYKFIGVGGRIGELKKAGVEDVFANYANLDSFLATIARLIS